MKKSSALCRKYASGGQVGDPNIKLTDDEIKQMRLAKNDPNDPNAYKKAVQATIGFTPKKYPAGSEGAKEQAQKYNTAVALVNNGYRPTSKVVNGKIVTGYKMISSNDDNDNDNGYAYGGNVEDMPASSDVPYSDVRDNGFRFDHANDKKLQEFGFRPNGTRNRMGKWGSILAPGYGIITNKLARNTEKGSASDTANIINNNSGEENKLRESMYLSMVAAALPGETKKVMNSQQSYKTNIHTEGSLNRLNIQDPNLEKQSAESTYGKWADGLGVAGKVVGAIYGMKGKGGGDDKSNTPQQLPQDSNVTNQNSLMANGTSMTDDQLYRQSAKDGGKIKGPGTTKSDSIKANVPDGSFVVPAEYADQAVALRKKYFGNPGKEADLKSGDVPVNLSNKEHIFTPEEKAVLESNGVDLNKLAPNAKNKANMADGGKVENVIEDDDVIKAAKAKKEALDKKKSEEEANKKDAEQKLRADSEEKIKQNQIKRNIQNYDSRLASKKEELEKAKRNLKDATDSGYLEGNRWNHGINSGIKNVERIQKEHDDLVKHSQMARDTKNYKQGNDSQWRYTPPTPPKEKINVSYSPEAIKNADNVPALLKPQSVTKGKGTSSALAKKASTQTTITATTQPEKQFEQNLYGLKTNNEGAPVTEQNINPDATELKQASPATGSLNYDNGSAIVDTPSISAQQSALASGKGKNGSNNGPGIGELLGAGQIAAGAIGLIHQGKRNTYKIGQNVLDDESQAIDNAKYGYTPAEMELQKRDIESHRIASEKNIINLSNDAGTALANIRSSSIDANHASLELAARDAELKRQKFGMKSAIVNNVENRRRQIFEDKLNKFKENQAATADLLNAGIGNVVGASERRRFNNQVQDAENVNVNYGFN